MWGEDAVWACRNKKGGDTLGLVEFYRGWHLHVFIAASRAVIFSASCLRDIAHFLDQCDAGLPEKSEKGGDL
jgi:hypothetical protein